MPNPSQNIPLNTQDGWTTAGLAIGYLDYEGSTKHQHILHTHRDDYYILGVVIKGGGTMRCDMDNITIKPNSIFFIRPYQVHSASGISKDAEAYFIIVAPFLMPNHCSVAFENLSPAQQQVKIPKAQQRAVLSTCRLLHKAFEEDNIHKIHIAHSLFNALINRISALFLASEKEDQHPKNQSYNITQKFKQLVLQYSFLHSAAFFAGKLNITTSHLNDCVKSTTGLSVTAYLQQAMLLEAKRYLYYTNNDVKKVAYTLGFEDHTYFSRLFKKLTKETPLEFRNKFRE